MNEALVKNSVEAITDAIDVYPKAVGQIVTYREKRVEKLVKAFQENTEIRVNALELKVIPGVHLLTARATLQATRVTFHASPEIIAIIMAMVTIYNIVTWVIRIFNVIRVIGTIWEVHKIVMAVWPRYREWWTGFMTDVSNASAALGWGVDGISHLMNATASGINVLGGLMGKSWDIMRFEMMSQGSDIAQTMSRMINALQQDPGRWLNTLFENKNLLTAYNTGKWWSETYRVIQVGLDKAEAASNGILSVTQSLLSIQNNMPNIVRANIPTSIWLKLSSTENFIQSQILPNIWNINRSLSQLNSVLATQRSDLSNLAGKLAHPGELLLTVDDLPGYAKTAQLQMIDDVTSREFEYWTNQERSELQHDLNEFDRIDRLATAPTPQPAYFNLEVPRGRTLRGVTAEPQETWFIGGYNDPR